MRDGRRGMIFSRIIVAGSGRAIPVGGWGHDMFPQSSQRTERAQRRRACDHDDDHDDVNDDDGWAFASEPPPPACRNP